MAAIWCLPIASTASAQLLRRPNSTWGSTGQPLARPPDGLSDILATGLVGLACLAIVITAFAWSRWQLSRAAGGCDQLVELELLDERARFCRRSLTAAILLVTPVVGIATILIGSFYNLFAGHLSLIAMVVTCWTLVAGGVYFVAVGRLRRQLEDCIEQHRAASES